MSLYQMSSPRRSPVEPSFILQEGINLDHSGQIEGEVGVDPRYQANMTRSIKVFRCLVMPKPEEAEYTDLANGILHHSPKTIFKVTVNWMDNDFSIHTTSHSLDPCPGP